MTQKRKTISLPPLPDSWNKLSSQELEEVNRLMVKRQELSETFGEEVADRDFKLKCFLLFTGTKVRRRTAKDKDGSFVYLLRRYGIRHLCERIPMRSWQVNQWIDAKLSFLDEPYKRIATPYTMIRLYGKKFKAPTDLMTNVNHHQYLSAQNLITKYWDTLKMADVLIGRKASRTAIAAQIKQIRSIQCKFLATLFTPQSLEVEVIREGRYVRKTKNKVFIFESGQIEANAWRFRHSANKMFPVMLQFFQSVQNYFGEIFPDLYTNRKDSKGRNYLQMEVEMINSIMKYQGFSSYQDVYESEAIRILGVLNTMSKEAKAIEDMNEKMRRKS